MVKETLNPRPGPFPKSVSQPPLPLRAFWKFLDLGSPYLVLFLHVLLRYARVQTGDPLHPSSLNPPQTPSEHSPP